MEAKGKNFSYKNEALKKLFDNLSNAQWNNFEESLYRNRKYNANNLEMGITFYKLRYLSRKLKISLKKNPSKTFQKRGKVLFPLKEEELEKLERHEMIDLERKQKVSPKDVVKYKKLFLILIEKSIVSFNYKYFKESYEILLDFDIIDNPYEFGEILLTETGYNREVIGDFISRNEYPNEKEEVANGFLGRIEINEFENVMEYLKFIFWRAKIPENAFKITKSITTLCYQDNQKIENINRLFKDKADLNSFLDVFIKLSQSSELNTEGVKVVLDQIFNIFPEEEKNKYLNEIINNTFTLENDYVNGFYKKMYYLLEEEDINYNSNVEIEFDNATNYNSSDLINIANKQRKLFFFLEEKNFIEKGYNRPSKKNIYFFKNFRATSYDEFSSKNDMPVISTLMLFHRVNDSSLSSHEKEYFSEGQKLYFKDKNAKDFIFKGSGSNINITDIKDLYLGTYHGENFKKYIKNFPKEIKNQNNYLSLLHTKGQHDLKSDNPDLLLKWYISMKRLINNNKNKINNNNVVDNNKIISKKVKTIWNGCISNKWDIYGPYLLFRQIENANPFSELTFPGKQESSKTFDEFYSTKKFGECLIEIEKYQKKGVLNYNEFIYFCQFGLPSFYRQRLWPILFNNNCQITFELFLILKGKVTIINSLFDKGTINISSYNEFTDNNTVNQLIKDILEIKYLFNHVILHKKLSQKAIVLQVYYICLSLFLYRIDIPYNKNMIYLIYTLLIRKLSEKETFIIVANLIFSNCLISNLYFLKNGPYIYDTEKFFNEKFEEHMPNLYNHFKNLGITSDLYIYDWFESLFTQFFNFKLSGVIIDLYIIDGEYILVQTALTILKIYEDALLNSSVIDTFKMLKKAPTDLDFVEFNTAFQTFGNLKQKFDEAKFNHEVLDIKLNIIGTNV